MCGAARTYTTYKTYIPGQPATNNLQPAASPTKTMMIGAFLMMGGLVLLGVIMFILSITTLRKKQL
jgi:hypothetical protein